MMPVPNGGGESPLETGRLLAGWGLLPAFPGLPQAEQSVKI